MAEYSAYRDLAQEIAGGLIVTDINELVQFTCDKAGLAMLRLLGGTIPSGVPGKGFKTQEPMIKRKSISAYEHKWIKQPVAPVDLIIQTGVTSSATTNIVLTAGTYSRAAEGGLYQAEDPNTGAMLEVLYLLSDTGSGNTCTFRRNIGSTTNANLPANTILRRRSHVVSDRSVQQKIHDVDPSISSNLTETIRVDWELTWKGAAQKEYGDLNNIEIIKKQKLYQFARYLNWSFLFGKGGTTTDENGKRVQFMTGLTNLITTHRYSAASPSGFDEGHGGELSLEEYRNVFLRTISRYIPDDVGEVMVLMGSYLEAAIDFWFKGLVSNVAQTETVIGWEVKTVKVNGKKFYHLYDSSVDEIDPGMAVVFPKNTLTYCFTSYNGISLDMKHYETKPQSSGVTAVGGFYLADVTLEIGWEQGTGVMSGVTSYV